MYTLLKSIQKWLHNKKKIKPWFCWLYMDFFEIFQYFWQTTVFCLVFILLVAITDWIKDLLIYLYKMIKQNSIYFRIQINHASFICLQFITGRCRRERNCVARRTVRMPINIILFIRLLLFCCMILFLTVLWLHRYWLCHHHVICCLYAAYHPMFKHVFTIEIKCNMG